jgi:HK97 family phage prohead protease
MGKILRKTYLASETKVADGEDRTLVVKISTSTPDRSRDIVRAEGVQLDNYVKNPVVAFGHNYSGLSIGKTVEIQKVTEGIIAKVEFTPKGVYPLADQLYEMYKGGFMNAWSIGFIPKKWVDKEDGGRDFEEWELLEYSAVLVPDNPEALTLLRSKGVDIEPLEKAMSEVKEEEEIKETEKEEKAEEVIKEKELKAKDVSLVNEEPKKEKVISRIGVHDDTNTITLRFTNGNTLDFVTDEKYARELRELGQLSTQIKEGRVLSEKNRKLVTDCLTSLKNTQSVLQALFDASEKEPKEVSNSNQVVVIDLAEALKAIDKVAGVALRDLRRKVNDGELGIVPEDSRVPIVIGEKGVK